MIFYKGLCSNGLYLIHSFSTSNSQQTYQVKAFLGQLIQSNLWHHKLGHPTNHVVSLMLNKAGVLVPKTSLSMMCHTCLEGKFSKLPFPQHVNKFVTPFETIHTDLWGPAPYISVDGYKYYTIFVDECTRYCWIFPLTNKSNLFSTFVVFYSFVVTQFSATIKTIQTDFRGGGTNTGLKHFLLEKGISHHLFCPYTPEQNGIAERKHRHIIETTITLLHLSYGPMLVKQPHI
jgi:hypothetical protein